MDVRAMSGRITKGSFLSDKLKPWHIILLAALVIGLFSVQWWLNERKTVEEYPEVIEQSQ